MFLGCKELVKWFEKFQLQQYYNTAAMECSLVVEIIFCRIINAKR